MSNNGIPKAAAAYRDAQAALNEARQELEQAIAAEGWQLLFNHTGTDGAVVSATYKRPAGPVDPVTGDHVDTHIRTFADFVEAT